MVGEENPSVKTACNVFTKLSLTTVNVHFVVLSYSNNITRYNIMYSYIY